MADEYLIMLIAGRRIALSDLAITTRHFGEILKSQRQQFLLVDAVEKYERCATAYSSSIAVTRLNFLHHKFLASGAKKHDNIFSGVIYIIKS